MTRRQDNRQAPRSAPSASGQADRAATANTMPSSPHSVTTRGNDHSSHQCECGQRLGVTQEPRKRRRDDERARSHCEAAERLFAVADPHGVSNAVASQAVVHRRRGDLERALALNERALGLYRQAAIE